MPKKSAKKNIILPTLTPVFYQQVIKNAAVRRAVTKDSHLFFFYIYFYHYVQYDIAPFQREIFALTEDETIKNAIIIAFRGSGKSTLITLSYVLWAILGKKQKKFIVILGQTQAQARQHLKNIKAELEGNLLLRADLGPFEEENFEWGLQGLVLPKYGAKIIAASTEQSIRGIRHLQHRPDLIIGDDLEDLTSIKTLEGRNKVHQWLTGEVLPAGSRNTQMILIGNLLHEDSLLMRLKDGITHGRFEGVFRMYPLLDEEGRCAWPAMFPTLDSIEAARKALGNENAWQREFLLKIVPEEDQIIMPEWIDNNYYHHLPDNTPAYELIETVTGIDLAISKEETADYTAMVTVKIYRKRETGERHLYILPHPVNKRLNFAETIVQVQTVADSLEHSSRTSFLVEDVAYQRAAIEQLQANRLYVKSFTPMGDKSTRLKLTTPFFKNGLIHLPQEGSKLLRQQLLGFGSEKHDDLVDALSMIILEQSRKPHPLPAGQISTFLSTPRGESGTIFGNIWKRKF